MVRGTLRFLAAPVRGLQSAVYVLAGAAVASSILALLRDRLFAHAFGAGAELDVYYAAFRLPDLIFVGIGALVSVYVLIPELSRRSEEDQKGYIDSIVVGFSLLAGAVALVVFTLAPAALAALFPQIAASQYFGELVLLTRILLLQPILLGFSNILAAVTQSRHRYTLYALSPLVYNLAIIVGVIAFYPLFGLKGLAFGVVLGALLHAGIQLPSLLAEGFFRSAPRFARAVFVRTIATSVPRALALSVNQLTFIGLTVLAGTMTAGSIAVFMFSFNLQAVPLAIIGASYSVAAFPALSTAYAAGRYEEFLEQISSAARHVLFWSLPATALLIVLRAHVVRTVLGSGAFDWTDTRLTAAALAFFSLSLAAQGITLLLVRGYYAANRTFVPLVIAFFAAATALAIAVMSLRVFSDTNLHIALQSLARLEDVPGTLVVVLAWSYSMAAIAGSVALIVLFGRQFGPIVPRIRRALYESFAAAVVAAAAAYAVLVVLGPLTLASTTASVFFRGLLAGVVGVLAAALVYRYLGNNEYAENMATIRGKLWRAPESKEVVSSGEDIGHGST